MPCLHLNSPFWSPKISLQQVFRAPCSAFSCQIETLHDLLDKYMQKAEDSGYGASLGYDAQ
jgi:hypothetical protein